MDALTGALEPGEKILWRDGPHGLRHAARKAIAGPTAYAVTDRRRVLVLRGGTLATFPLPPPERITTRARADEERGDLDLDGRVLEDVSYPLIALETLRAAWTPPTP